MSLPWAKSNKEQYRERKRCEARARLEKGLCSKCIQPLVQGVLGGSYYCEKHLQKKKVRLARQRQTLKLAAFCAYGGPACKCCGEKRMEFLSIDHINGGGRQHCKEIGTTSLYHWLSKNGYPPGFQVLCLNCNFAKGHYGICPHEVERKAALAPPPPPSPKNP